MHHFACMCSLVEFIANVIFSDIFIQFLIITIRGSAKTALTTLENRNYIFLSCDEMFFFNNKIWIAIYLTCSAITDKTKQTYVYGIFIVFSNNIAIEIKLLFYTYLVFLPRLFFFFNTNFIYQNINFIRPKSTMTFNYK